MFEIDKAIENNENLFYLNDNGRLEFAYSQDVMSELQQIFKNIDSNINLDPSTPQGQIITNNTQIINACIEYLEDLANGFFFGGQGIFLDMALWNQFRLKRKGAVYSSVVLEFTGEPEFLIPEGFECTNGSLNFKTIKDLRLNDNGVGYVLAEQTTLSEDIAPANSIKDFIAPLPEVATVNNLEPSTQSIFRESDSDFYLRAWNYGSIGANSTFRSILANVSAVEGVKKVVGEENFTNITTVQRGLTCKPHSINIVVQGGKNEDIARAILNTRPPGTFMGGDTTVKLKVDDMEYKISFYRPTTIAFQVKILVKTNVNTPQNYEQILKNRVLDFFQNLEIASNITQPNISSAVSEDFELFEVLDIQFSLKDYEYGYSPYQLKLNEEAFISRDFIKVQDDATTTKIK